MNLEIGENSVERLRDRITGGFGFNEEDFKGSGKILASECREDGVFIAPGFLARGFVVGDYDDADGWPGVCAYLLRSGDADRRFATVRRCRLGEVLNDPNRPFRLSAR